MKGFLHNSLSDISYSVIIATTRRMRSYQFGLEYYSSYILDIFPKKKCIKAKWLSEEALQIAEKRRAAKGKEERERYTHLNAELQE